MSGLSNGVRRGALALVLGTVATIGVVGTTVAPGGAAPAPCTTTWTAPTSGSWDTAAGWSGGAVPSATDHVCITAPGDYTVTLTDPGAPVVVASLRIGGATGAGAQRLVVQRGASNPASSLTATTGVEIGARGVLALGQPSDDDGRVAVAVGIGATIANAGRIEQVAGFGHTLRGDVVNTGHVEVDDALRVEGDLTTDGTIHLAAVVRVTGQLWTRSGTFSGGWAVVAEGGVRVGEAHVDAAAGGPQLAVESGGTVTFDSEAPAEITTYGDVTVVGDTAARQDLMVSTIDGVDARLFVPADWIVGGDLLLAPDEGADVAVVGAGTDPDITIQGRIARNEETGAATVVADVDNRASLEASSGGVLAIDGDLRSNAVLEIDNGDVEVTGAVVLGAASRVQTTMRAGDGPDLGSITAGGAATVDGDVHVHTPTAPPVGSSTPLVSGASRSGTFDAVRFSGSASYDADYRATAVALVRRAPEPATHRFVRAAYQDFLDRQPTPGELAARAAAIDGGSSSRAALVGELSRSAEYVSALVQRFYADTLGRPGEPDGVAFWVHQLRTGRWTEAQVAGSFYASDEYRARTGDTDEAWIDDLYQVFFGRAPDIDGRDWWVDRIALRGRTSVAVDLYQSLESRRARVVTLYHQLLGRIGDPGGIDYWAARLVREGDLALAVFLAASPEYLHTAQLRYP